MKKYNIKSNREKSSLCRMFFDIVDQSNRNFTLILEIDDDYTVPDDLITLATRVVEKIEQM